MRSLRLPPFISLTPLNRYTSRRAAEGVIDALQHMALSSMYLYSGSKDTVVWQREMKTTAEYFARYTKAANVLAVWNVSSEHGYITDACCQPCDEPPRAPNDGFILNCGYDQPGRMLAHLYGDSALLNRTAAGAAPRRNILRANQSAYLPPGVNLSAAQLGALSYVYVPSRCAELPRAQLTTVCRVHVNYHGCGGGGPTVVENAGYTEHAEMNDVIVLFPQAASGPGNPNGCWDWTGVTGSAFDTRGGVQIGTVVRLINDLANAIDWPTAASSAE